MLKQPGKGSMAAWVAKKGIRRRDSEEPAEEREPSTAQQWVHTSSVRDRANLWKKQTSEPEEKQTANPFAHKDCKQDGKWDGTARYMSLGGHDETYGRPVAGSKTEKRGVNAGAQISGEVVELCEVIYDYGQPMEDGTRAILFGTLFELYTRISNKVVGMLMRARRHGLVQFEGEMLYQRRDEGVVIRLVDIPPALEAHIAEVEGRQSM